MTEETRSSGHASIVAFRMRAPQGVAGVAERARQADMWQARATAAAQQLGRLKCAYQHGGST